MDIITMNLELQHKFEKLLAKHTREVEEHFMLGYTEVEYDFMKMRTNISGCL